MEAPVTQAVKSNRDDLNDLAEQAYATMLVVATSLKGKQEKDITRDTKHNLERLSE